MTPIQTDALKLPLKTENLGISGSTHIIDATGSLIATANEPIAKAICDSLNREPKYRAALEELIEAVHELLHLGCYSDDKQEAVKMECRELAAKAAALLAGGGDK